MATLKETKNYFQDQLSLNAGQKYCWMLQGEHSAILSTFIKLPFVIKIFVLSIFEWPLKTGFTVSVPALLMLLKQTVWFNPFKITISIEGKGGNLQSIKKQKI